jgi:hypothetical protein
MGGGGGFELPGTSPALDVFMRFGGGGFELLFAASAALLAPG